MRTKVREYRRMAGMTQQQLADAVGVSARTIISIEKEQYSPSLMLAYRMARLFGTSVEELCLLEDNLRMEGEGSTLCTSRISSRPSSRSGITRAGCEPAYASVRPAP